MESLGGWLTTVVGRVCLDMLRSRKARWEGHFGTHPPDPIVSRAGGDKDILADPERLRQLERVSLDD